MQPLSDPTAWQMFISLLPVITGGLIGIAGGLSGTVVASLLKAKQDRAAHKRIRLEDIVLACHGTKTWTDKMDNHFLFGGPEILEPLPSAIAAGYASMYFPTLKDLADQYELAALAYASAVITQKTDMLAKKLKGPEDAHTQAMQEPYKKLSSARSALQQAAEKLMRTL